MVQTWNGLKNLILGRFSSGKNIVLVMPDRATAKVTVTKPPQKPLCIVQYVSYILILRSKTASFLIVEVSFLG